MDAQRLGDPADDPGVTTGRLLDKLRKVGRGVTPRSKEVRVYCHLLGPIGDAGIEPLLHSRFLKLHVGVVNDAQAETLSHHPRDLTEKLV